MPHVTHSSSPWLVPAPDCHVGDLQLTCPLVAPWVASSLLPPATLASAVCPIACIRVSSLGSRASSCQGHTLRPYLSHLQPPGYGFVPRGLSGRPPKLWLIAEPLPAAGAWAVGAATPPLSRVSRGRHGWLGPLSVVSLHCACPVGTYHHGALAGLSTPSEGVCHHSDPAWYRDRSRQARGTRVRPGDPCLLPTVAVAPWWL